MRLLEGTSLDFLEESGLMDFEQFVVVDESSWIDTGFCPAHWIAAVVTCEICGGAGGWRE